MSNLYKTAVLEKWRFQSIKGLLNVEQLATLPLTSKGEDSASLNEVAKKLSKQIKDTEEEDFVGELTTGNKLLVQQLELVKDLIATRKEENAALLKAKETKEHNARIDQLIAAKKEEKMANLSIEELEALRK